MINIKNILEKSAVYSGIKESLLLVEFNAEKKKKTTKQPKLNVSFVIDVSGSMNLPVKRQSYTPVPNIDFPKIVQPAPWINPQEPWMHKKWFENQAGINNWQPQLNYTPVISKLEQAKEATKKAINQMKDNDFVSLVIFDDNATLIAPSVELNSSTRATLLSQVSALHIGSSTNLYDGWLMGATEVAKKMSKEFVNRVIVITDGETNKGIQDPVRIAQDVAGLYTKSISTTTFGLGESFNEDLLQKMANAGGGNFYYIESDQMLAQMFIDEFNGLTNLCATEVKLSLELDNGELVENMNQYEKSEQSFLIPNIQHSNKTYAFFKVKMGVSKGLKEFNLGRTVITFKDSEGQNQKISSDIIIPVVSKKEWEALDMNEEVKVQETLLVIAQNKISATHALDAGNYAGAKDFLTASVNYASASGFNDARLQSEIGTLTSTLSAADSGSQAAFRKDLSYQSYKTRHNK